MKTKIELSEKQIFGIIHALEVAWGDYDVTTVDSLSTKGKEEMEKLSYIFKKALLQLKKSKEVKKIKSKEVEKRTKYLLKKFKDSQKQNKGE